MATLFGLLRSVVTTEMHRGYRVLSKRSDRKAQLLIRRSLIHGGTDRCEAGVDQRLEERLGRQTFARLGGSQTGDRAERTLTIRPVEPGDVGRGPAAEPAPLERKRFEGHRSPYVTTIARTLDRQIGERRQTRWAV